MHKDLLAYSAFLRYETKRETLSSKNQEKLISLAYKNTCTFDLNHMLFDEIISESSGNLRRSFTLLDVFRKLAIDIV